VRERVGVAHAPVHLGGLERGQGVGLAAEVLLQAHHGLGGGTSTA